MARNATTPTPVETLTPVAFKGAPVITTELLAAVYGTDSVRIRQNHANNSDRFVEGKHFHKVEGRALADLKTEYSKDTQFQIGKNARSLILWTERGAARHAKMLETDQAWDMFEKLEDAYFRPREDSRASRETPKRMTLADMDRARRIVAECRKTMGTRAAQAMWRDLGLPGSAPDQLALPTTVAGHDLREGLGMMMIDGKVVVFDAADTIVRHGDTALAVLPVMTGQTPELRVTTATERDGYHDRPLGDRTILHVDGVIFSTIKVLYCGTAKPLIFLG